MKPTDCHTTSSAAHSTLSGTRPARNRAIVLVLSAAVSLSATSAWALLSDYQTAVTNEPSLISYYTFDQSDASDTKMLYWGEEKGVPVAYVPGVDGEGIALSLNGQNWINLNYASELAFPDGDGSIETWFRAGTRNYNANLFANRDGATRYSINLNTDKQGIGMWNGNAYFPTVPIPDAGASWHHLVVVFETNDFKVYLDGAYAGSVNRPFGGNTSLPTQLGSTSPFAVDEGWVGELDEVAFYADPLPLTAVQAHYQAFLTGKLPVIVQQPHGGTYLPGVTLNLKVQATGPNLTYQWFKNNVPLAGQTAAVLTLPGLGAGDAGAYSVKVSNVAGEVTSDSVAVALELALPAALTAYQTAISNETSLLSYYTFDHLQPQDDFGAHDGNLSGSADWGAGLGGGAAQALALNGKGHVRLGAVPDFDFTSGSGTIEAWLRADWGAGDTVADYPCLFANRNGGTRWSVHMSKNKSSLTFYNGSSSSLYAIPGGAGTNWHHIAAVIDAGNVSYYWDGTLLATLARPLGNANVTVQLGSSADSTTAEGWFGRLDEVAFYSEALSAAAIEAHYTAYAGNFPPELTAQPTGGYYLANQPWQISVGATGAQLSYQWYRDGVAIPGATSATYGAGAASPALSGTYHVEISNPNGTVISDDVAVHIGNNIVDYQEAVQNETSLISHYTFDHEDAEDAQGLNPGTIVGAGETSVTFAPGAGGVPNKALVLDGTGHIRLGEVEAFNFYSGSGTVEAWVRANWENPAPYDPTIFADRWGGSVWSIHMERWKNFIGNWNGERFYQQPVSGATQWHHYAVVFEGGLTKMYWDGQPVGTAIQALNNFQGRTTQIGSSAPDVTTEGWMGDLDEVAFYSEALDEATLWNHYVAMTGSALPLPPALTITFSGNQVTVSWSTEVSNFGLETTDDLPGGTWTPVPGVVNNSVTLEATGGSRFFRLRKTEPAT